MLNTEKSFPIEELLSRPVVMELEDIGDDDVKGFIMGIILVQLYEYRKTKLTRNKKFEHLILIEEAHRSISECESRWRGKSQGQSSRIFYELVS